MELNNVVTLMGDRQNTGDAYMIPDIPFAKPGDRQLRIQFLHPGRNPQPDTKYPLIVFVQGSAWTFPNPHYRIPQLSMFARAGFAVASVEHRASVEAPFPACLIDVKRAIRYLRAHAATLHVDPDRIAIWGTSSGGNLALLTAATCGMPEFSQGDALDQSESVSAVVDFFGPSDLIAFMDEIGMTKENCDPNEPIYPLIGGTDGDYRARLNAISPTAYLKEGQALPPHLILHGDRDDVVPFSQSALYHEKLLAMGVSSTLAKVTGAAHEEAFWTDDVLNLVLKFLRAHL